MHCAFCIVHLQAQVDSIIYQCDFEDPEERALWNDEDRMNTGNQGKQCLNQWYLGKAGSNGGDYGLFVSEDGTTNNYTDKNANRICFELECKDSTGKITKQYV